MSTKSTKSLKEYCQKEIDWAENNIIYWHSLPMSDDVIADVKWLEGWRYAHKQIMEEFTK